MVLAIEDYSAADLLLTILYFFGLVIYFWLLITIFADLFRNHEMSGWIKAFWVLFVLIFPFFGILIYLIAYGRGMAQRAMRQRQQEMDALRAELGTSGSAADEVGKLADLKDRGVISDDEYQRLKAKVTS